MRIKHNKKRNTAFVYEALIKEATIAILKKDIDKRDKVISLVKEHFKPGSVLKKDLDCYYSLLAKQNLDRLTSEKILKESKLQRRLIDMNGLFQQQSTLINDVNKELSPEVFNNFVPNYKTLASIAQIFSDKISPKSRVILENEIIQGMLDTEDNVVVENSDSLVYNTFVKKFNEKYGTELLEEQKQLLSHYISSFTDNALELKMFLNEEIKRLIQQLEEAKSIEEISNDQAMINKTQDIISKLQGYSQTTIDDDVLMTVMKTQELVKEIYSDANHS